MCTGIFTGVSPISHATGRRTALLLLLLLLLLLPPPPLSGVAGGVMPWC